MRAQPRSRNSSKCPLFPVELVEVGAILRGEFGLVGGQVGFGENGILLAQIGAVATVDALVGVDEYLGDGSRLGIAFSGRNGGGGAISHADEILDARIGHYISHGSNSSAHIRSGGAFI